MEVALKSPVVVLMELRLQEIAVQIMAMLSARVVTLDITTMEVTPHVMQTCVLVLMGLRLRARIVPTTVTFTVLLVPLPVIMSMDRISVVSNSVLALTE